MCLDLVDPRAGQSLPWHRLGTLRARWRTRRHPVARRWVLGDYGSTRTLGGTRSFADPKGDALEGSAPSIKRMGSRSAGRRARGFS